MQKLRISPKQTIYIGDMAIDAQAGRWAQVRTVIVTTGSSTRLQIKKQKPYRIINRLSELFYLL